MSDESDTEGGVVVKDKTTKKLARPRLFRVLLHNDDFTTRDFVVEVLRTVFHKSEAESVDIMLRVHQVGVGIAGVYTYEIAETKIAVVRAMARKGGFPLRLSLEPEEQ